MNVSTKNNIIFSFPGNKRIIVGVILVAIAVIIPFFTSEYIQTLIQKGLLWIPSVYGVYFLYSLLHQVHFAQSIFIGLGGYLTAFLAGKYFFTNELLILLPIGLLIGGVVSALLGIIIMKRTGFYFAVMGIAITMVFWSIVYKARDLTGGSDGIPGIRNPSIFTIQLSNQGLYYVSLILSISMILLMLRILKSPFSLQLRAIGGDLDKSESIGIPVKKMQRVAFIIAGVFASMTGIMLAFMYNYVSPETFSWDYGSIFVQAAILGGTVYLESPILGVFCFIILEFLVSTWFPFLWEIIIGLGIVIIIITLGEEGFTGLARKLFSRIMFKRNLLERTYKNGK